MLNRWRRRRKGLGLEGTSEDPLPLADSWHWEVGDSSTSETGGEANRDANLGVGAWTDLDTLEIEVKGGPERTVYLSWVPDYASAFDGDYERPLNVRVLAPDCTDLSIDIYPSQLHASLGTIELETQATNISVASPIWGDRTEMGTAAIDSITIKQGNAVLRLGGDELNIRRLVGVSHPLPNGGTHHHPPAVTIAARSRVFLGTTPSRINMEDDSFVELRGGHGFSLGTIGIDAEIAARGPVAYLWDWDVERCTGNERLHLIGTSRLDYVLQRRVARMVQDKPDLLATYAPGNADELPPDITMSLGAKRDWVRTQERLIEAYCDDPSVTADARWRSYQVRREAADRFSITWFALNAMRGLGYGLKSRPPFIAWLASTAAVIGIWSIATHQRLDVTHFASWWRGLVLVVEGLMLPAGIFSLADSPNNHVLILDGTPLRLARLACSIPFAALIFAIQARVRIPKLSDAKA